MFDDNDDRFEEDLFDDRDIDNDDLIDGFDLDSSRSGSSSGQGLGQGGAGWLIFLLALPAAILLLMLL